MSQCFFIFCSKDFAKSWPKSYRFNGLQRGGYSAMVYLPEENSILIVWEDGGKPGEGTSDKDAGNFYSKQVDLGWC